MVETRQGSELEDSMRSTEELLEREQRYGSLLETDKPKLTGTTNKVRFYFTAFMQKIHPTNVVSFFKIKFEGFLKI